jgi:hypothetical protein
MAATRFSKKIRPLLGAVGLAVAPASFGLDVHLQELPPAPGLVPSAALDPLEGVRETVNCGLDFLDTAKHCGLAAPAETASPFLVRFDPLFCRLTMRFAIGELIDGLLGRWLGGAFANLETPVIGALCLLGIGPRDCGSPETAALPRSPVVPHRAPPAPTSTARHSAFQDALRAAQEEPAARGAALSPPPPPPETDRHDATGLDSLTR